MQTRQVETRTVPLLRRLLRLSPQVEVPRLGGRDSREPSESGPQEDVDSREAKATRGKRHRRRRSQRFGDDTADERA